MGRPGFAFADLFDTAGLARLDADFVRFVAARDAAAHALLLDGRARDLDALAVSARVVELAPHVEAYLTELFGIEEALRARRPADDADAVVFDFRKRFAKKRLLKPKARPPLPEEARARVGAAIAHLAGDPLARERDEELRVARATLAIDDLLDTARKVARAGGDAWTDEQTARLSSLRAALGDDGTEAPEPWLTALVDALEARLAERAADPADPASAWPSLRVVHPQDFDRLVPLRTSAHGDLVGVHSGSSGHGRERSEPFALTDHRGARREAAGHIAECLYCHTRGKDSCSTGLLDKQGQVKNNPLGAALAGCPLDEKIGEAQALRRDGFVLGALAAITLDNPMCPGTGHRICNDCMKSCVFQTMEPVNVPLVETRVLDEVLSLPWGYEIWSLLTRWSPLARERVVPRPYHGRKVLVVGLGPAGYTLAHYLVNEGFAVVAIDGLKIEPIDARHEGAPIAIRDAALLEEDLSRRTVLGFGGVSEYGITVRWDKSFLTMLYLNLARRDGFTAFGGVRFGGTLTLDDAWALGFDHVAIASGAGRPNLLSIPNGMARGVRQASDFLMGLQLSGAFRRDGVANLGLRLPAIVIGSGLTAIDTATEALAYYVIEVERTLDRFEALAAEHGDAAARAGLDEEELLLLEESLEHGRAIRDERALAAREGREPRLRELLDGWGGVRLVYRRRMVDSPAYRLNHEEVAKSLEEGVRYVELASPTEVHVDRFGALEAVSFERMASDGAELTSTGETFRLPARSMFVAAGTKPNVSYEREYPGTFALDRRGYFQTHRVARDGDAVRLEPGQGFFTSHLGPDGRTVSFYGDNHPTYAGSVVKAMASAKHGHRAVVESFGDALDAVADPAERDTFFAGLHDRLDAEVIEVRTLAPGIVDVRVRAPQAAKNFAPGQFFRLQTYERYAPRRGDVPLVMEGIALTGAWHDPERGILSLIVLEVGLSSRLCERLKVGEPVVVMGPTGRPSDIAEGERVALVGGGLGNAVLFSIAKAFKDAGSEVLYFAGYRDGALLFERESIEAACDQVIWATDTGAEIVPSRPQDAHVRGNIVQAMLSYANGELTRPLVPLDQVDRILAIGSDGMMRAVTEARHGVLKSHLKPDHIAIGSINSPMQCMLKEVCAQCLQRHVDPVTGEERLVYSCFDQDQPLDRVDFAHLKQRLRQSSLQEKLTDRWAQLPE
ncbi:MAG: FAD-dependent oxidoreductase [Sandaracinaceae bacterium]